MVKHHSTEIIKDVLYDFYNFKISFSNLLLDIYSLPFHIAFKSFSILKSESNLPVPMDYFENLPALITTPLSTFYNIGIASFEYLSNIYNLASSSYGYLKSGFTKIYSNGKKAYDLYKEDNWEKLKIILKYLYHRDITNFIFLLINSLNFIVIILSIIILIFDKAITNFIAFKRETNFKRKN